jgi:hypothetical protein
VKLGQIGRILIFWDWRQWRKWGLAAPPSPFLPYEWALYMGPLALCELTCKKPRRLTRQERRQFERALGIRQKRKKAARRKARRQ